MRVHVVLMVNDLCVHVVLIVNDLCVHVLLVVCCDSRVFA